MKIKMTENSDRFGAPVGLYKATFTRAKEDNHPEFGAGLKWTFQICEGPYAGKIVSRTTAPVATLKNSCGRMLQAITGGEVKPGDEFDDSEFIGTEFRIMMEPNSAGTGTRVGTAMPLGTPPPRGAA